MSIENSEIRSLATELMRLDIVLEKDIVRLEQIISSLEQKLKDLKSDVWDLKSYGKQIAQNDKDIAILAEQVSGLNKLLIHNKKELESKMITRKELESNKYRSLNFWLAVIALVMSILFGILNYSQNENKNHGENTYVSSNNKK